MFLLTNRGGLHGDIIDILDVFAIVIIEYQGECVQIYFIHTRSM